MVVRQKSLNVYVQSKEGKMMERTYDLEFQEKIKGALEDETFVNKLALCETESEYEKVLAEKDIAADEELISLIKHDVQEIRETVELNEEILDEVSGGFAMITLLGAATFVGAAVVAGYVAWKIGKAIINRCSK